MKELEKLEQRKRVKRAQESRELIELRKLGVRRQILVGGLFLKYFPEFASLQPRRTSAENEIEFSPLENMFKSMTAYKEQVTRPQEINEPRVVP